MAKPKLKISKSVVRTLAYLCLALMLYVGYETASTYFLYKHGQQFEDQIKAEKPTLDYDTRYGDPSAFIDAIYRDLSAKK